MCAFCFINFNLIFVLVNLNFETSYTYTSSTMNSESMHILRPALGGIMGMKDSSKFEFQVRIEIFLTLQENRGLVVTAS